MSMKYEKPDILLEAYEENDIICTSITPSVGDGGDGWTDEAP